MPSAPNLSQSTATFKTIERVKLHFKKYGDGNPVIILHGLFGSSVNWNTIGKKLAEHFLVYLVDLRNHGRSPHSNEFDYQVMCEDIYEFINDHLINDAILIGHSMGGKNGNDLCS